MTINTIHVFQMLSISLTDKAPLRDLFSKTKFQNDKEIFRFDEPSFLNL